MSVIEFKDTKNTLTIKAPDIEEPKVYGYEVGNYEQMERWMAEMEKIDKLQNRLQSEKNETVLPDLREMEENIITMVLGSDAWDFIYEISGHNVIKIIAVVRQLSKDINEAMAEMQKGYV